MPNIRWTTTEFEKWVMNQGALTPWAWPEGTWFRKRLQWVRYQTNPTAVTIAVAESRREEVSE